MTEQQIYKKIEEIYATEKGKNFISHLARAFFPVNRTFFMLSEDEKKGSKMVCCLTGKKLVAKEKLIYKAIAPESMNVFLEHLKLSLDPEKKASPELEKHVKEINDLKSRLALVCEKSDKLLSVDGFKALQNFLLSEMLKGNRHLNHTFNDERSKEYVKHGKKEGWIKNKAEENVVRKVAAKDNPKAAKLSLGELDVLKQLKERMESEEKSKA